VTVRPVRRGREAENLDRSIRPRRATGEPGCNNSIRLQLQLHDCNSNQQTLRERHARASVRRTATRPLQ